MPIEDIVGDFIDDAYFFGIESRQFRFGKSEEFFFWIAPDIRLSDGQLFFILQFLHDGIDMFWNGAIEMLDVGLTGQAFPSIPIGQDIAVPKNLVEFRSAEDGRILCKEANIENKRLQSFLTDALFPYRLFPKWRHLEFLIFANLTSLLDSIIRRSLLKEGPSLEVKFPEACRMDFKSCRDFLNKGSDHRIEDEEIDFGLEKVDSLSDSLSKSREKANVLGFGMVDEKKKALVALLTRHNIPLIEDDVYGDLHFGFYRPSVAKALDTSGNILYCSSFSKTLSPGLRTGWIIPGRFQEKVEHFKFVLNLSAPVVSQLAVARLLERWYEGHLRRVRRAYSVSVGRMIQIVEKRFPAGTKVTKPEGGFVLWVEFPEIVDAVILSRKAYMEGISIVPGELFSSTRKYSHHIRLNCAVPWSDRVEWALERIGQLSVHS